MVVLGVRVVLLPSWLLLLVILCRARCHIIVVILVLVVGTVVWYMVLLPSLLLHPIVYFPLSYLHEYWRSIIFILPISVV